jgi:hypothetical protein
VSARIQLVLAVLVGIAAAFIARALGLANVFTDLAKGVAFALLFLGRLLVVWQEKENSLMVLSRCFPIRPPLA